MKLAWDRYQLKEFSWLPSALSESDYSGSTNIETIQKVFKETNFVDDDSNDWSAQRIQEEYHIDLNMFGY